MTSQSKTIIENCILKGPELILMKKNGHIGQITLDHLKENADIVGLIDSNTGESIRNGILAIESTKCALWLKKENIMAGDIISFCSPTSIPLYVSYLATFYIGKTASAFPPKLSLEMLRHYISSIRPKIVFTIEEEAKKIMDVLKEEKLEHTKIIIFGNLSGFESFNTILENESRDEIKNFQCSNVNSNDTAAVFMSSGSTGIPKFIEHSYEGLKYKLLYSLFECLSMENIRISWCIQLSGVTALLTSLVSFLCNSSIVIMTPRNIEEVFSLIDKYKLQMLYLTGPMFHEMVVSESLTKYNLSSIKILELIGCRITSKDIEAAKQVLPDCSISIFYGTTEIAEVVLKDVRYEKGKYLGALSWNTQMKVIDSKTGESLKLYQIGELCVKKKFMMKGYYNNPKSTKEVLDSKGWYHTGDLGYYDEKEMEDTLAKHPEVKSVAVIGVPHPLNGEHPIAFVIKAKNSQLSENDLIQFSSCLGENKMLRGVIFVENIPYSTSAKINKDELLKIFNMNQTIPI